MKRLLLLGVLGLSLAGCAMQPLVTSSARQPGMQLPQQPAHPRYAPPPGVKSHWSPALGVYVVEGARDLFYRERIFYRWDAGWRWAPRSGGPWQATDSQGIPPGLFRHYQGR